MAAALVPGVQFVKMYDSGDSDRIVLYALRKVTAGDTADLSGEFNPPLRGSMVGTTLNGVATLVTFTGNTVTIPVGPLSDAGYLLVYGVHS
jgi:hypothetical protein